MAGGGDEGLTFSLKVMGWGATLAGETKIVAAGSDVGGKVR